MSKKKFTSEECLNGNELKENNTPFSIENLNNVSMQPDVEYIFANHLQLVNDNPDNADNQILSCNQFQDTGKSNFDNLNVLKNDIMENMQNIKQNEVSVSNSLQELVYNIFTLNDLNICLICKSVLNSTSNIHETSQYLKNHVVSDEHKIHLKALFKECTQDPACESREQKYRLIVNNSCIDFSSVLDQKSSFVSKDGDSISCVICKDRILSLKDTEVAVVDTIRNHLVNERHSRNLQDNISWVCTLPSEAGCITFYKTLVYCTICDGSIRCKEHHLVRTAVHHLETNHPKVIFSHDFVKDKLNVDINEIQNRLELLRLDDTIGSFSDTDKSNSDNVSDTWFDEDILTSRSDSTNEKSKDGSQGVFLSHERVDIFSTDVESDSSENEVNINIEHSPNNEPGNSDDMYLCTECGENIEIVNGDVETSINLHLERHEATDPPNIEDSPSNKVYASNTHLCPECGDSLEILNNDIEFSLQVHSQKHEVAGNYSVKVETSPCSFDENIDYVCSDCEKAVTVYNKDIELSFNHHYQDCHTNVEELVTAQERVAANDKFACDVFDCLPETLQKNRTVIVMKQNAMFCMLCNCHIEIIVKNVFSTSVLLNDHLLLKYHINQYNAVTEVANVSDRDNKPKFKSNVQLFTQKKMVNTSEQKPDKLKNISSVNQSKEYTKDNQAEYQSTSQSLLAKTTTSKPTVVSNISNDIASSTCAIPGENKTVLLNTLFSDLPEGLKVHEEFFTLLHNKISCCLCSLEVEANHRDVRNHITTISHRLQFLAKLKKFLEDGLRSQIRFLVFINGQLYCSECKCHITPWSDFDGICQAVRRHFKNVTHSAINQDFKTAGNSEENSLANPKPVKYESPKQIVPSDPEGCKNMVENVQLSSEAIDLDNSCNTLEDTVTCGKSKIISSPTNTSPKIKFNKELVCLSPGVSRCVFTRKQCPEPAAISYMSRPALEASLCLQHLHNEEAKSSNKFTSDNISGEIKTDLRNENSELKQNEVMHSTVEKPLCSSSFGAKRFVRIPVLETIKNFVPMLEVNVKFISRPDTNFYCSLCDRGISNSPNTKTLAMNFNKHFNSTTHKYFSKDLLKPVHEVKVANSKQNVKAPSSANNKVVYPGQDRSNKLWSASKSSFAKTTQKNLAKQVDRLNEISKIDSTVLKNLRFIECRGCDFFCRLCDATILNAYIDKTLVSNFVFHLKGYNHLYNLRRAANENTK